MSGKAAASLLLDAGSLPWGGASKASSEIHTGVKQGRVRTPESLQQTVVPCHNHATALSWGCVFSVAI